MSQFPRSRFLRALIVPFLLSIAVGTGAAAPTPAVAPELDARDATGAAQHLSSYRGKIVVLNFWATWCGPCRQETPDLVAVWRAYRDRGVVVVGYASDGLSGKVEVEKFLRQFSVDYPVWLGLSGGEMEAFGYAWSLPATTIIDRDGRIAASFRGAVNRESLSAELEKLLTARPAAVSTGTGKP